MIWEMFSVFVFPGLLSAIFIGLFYEGILRKITARMQNRQGPPLHQPLLDWIKTMAKENVTPKQANGFLMTLCPLVSFAAAAVAVLFLPIADVPFLNAYGSIFIFIYFLLISVIFLSISGFATGSPFGAVGSMREIMQIISYELPFIISIVTIGFLTGFAVTPFLAIGFPFAIFGFLLGIMGKLGLPPFHIPEAEQEIVEGPLTEYTGPRLGMFYLAKAAMLWALVSAACVMLFGGGGIIEFFIKSLAILFALAVLKNIFSRLKMGQAFRLYWLFVTPLVLIDLIRVILGLW